MPDRVTRAAVAVGAIVDAMVAVLAIFFQPLLGPLLDVPTKDPALTTIAGGEYVVIALVYVLVFRELSRYRALLWLLALDQSFAVVLPAYEIARGHVVATWKTLGPMPISVALAATYVAGARARRD